MSLSIAIFITAKSLSLTLFLQGIEYFFMSQRTSFKKIWSYQNLKTELENGLPFGKRLGPILFTNASVTKIALLQITISLIMLIQPHWLGFAFLVLIHLFFCIRFRGTFNGGSDMMTFVVLTGLLITLSSSSEVTQKLGLIYITIHTLYSYLKSGLTKIIHKEWRSGQALPVFLKRSLYSDMHTVARRLTSAPVLSLILGWSVIIFELLSISLIFFVEYRYYYFFAAVLFHLLIYIAFGLNRFFWIWISAWPATLFSLALLGNTL